MTFPNHTMYTIRVNYYDFDLNFIEAKEVKLSDDDLTDEQIDSLDQIIAEAFPVPVCANCLTSRPDQNVTDRPGKGLLCDCCVELIKITRPERSHRERRQETREEGSYEQA